MDSAVSRRFLILSLVTLVALILFLAQSRGFPTTTELKSRLRASTQRHQQSDLSEPIPNTVNYVFLLKDDKVDFPFELYQFISIYSATFHLKPDKVYLSTNAEDDQIARAREGKAGKWSKLVFDTPNLIINKVVSPRYAANGLEITHPAHKSDFVRAQVIQQFGGMYMDFDVYPIRDWAPLRKAGFNAVLGTEYGGFWTCGCFMAKKTSKFIQAWAEQMPKVFDGGWITHSNILMKGIGESLIPTPHEVLLVAESYFAPMHPSPEAAKELLQTHDDVPSNLDHILNGAEFVDDHPSWEMYADKIYALHAFGIEETGMKVTVRSLLDRRNRFSRLVYAAVKDLYDRQMISIDDE